MTEPEVISGYTSSVTAQLIDLSKQTFVDSFPPILILHLKRFVYDFKAGGTQKVRKHVRFDTSLKIKPKVMSPTGRKANEFVEYSLFAGKMQNILKATEEAMEARGFTGDVRFFKVLFVQEFLARMVADRTAKGMYA
ncbi:hypothetical protein HDU80_009218 [Chytriomyces hyalinus]|nr:hypothetical protein HDU80_009218 [Chytriomyces hyalinus]